jgi:hypothetical protein
MHATQLRPCQHFNTHIYATTTFRVSRQIFTSRIALYPPRALHSTSSKRLSSQTCLRPNGWIHQVLCSNDQPSCYAIMILLSTLFTFKFFRVIYTQCLGNLRERRGRYYGTCMSTDTIGMSINVAIQRASVAQFYTFTHFNTRTLMLW